MSSHEIVIMSASIRLRGCNSIDFEGNSPVTMKKVVLIETRARYIAMDINT